MKAFKRMALILGSTAGVFTLALSFYNSAALNNEAFMSANFDTNNKRLDELNGDIVIGRMAASTRSWESLEIQEEAKPVIKSFKFSNTNSVAKKEVVELEPAIKEDLELTLSSVKLGVKEKGKPNKLVELEKGAFTGSARTSNGYVEEVSVNLPDGRQIDIYSHKRMASNVFEYIDNEGNTRSAMMYESGKNTFTVMLTNDPHYPGSKLTFKTGGESLGNDSNLNWGMNDQNINSELAEGERMDEEYTQEDEVEYVQEDELKNNDNYSFQFNS